MSNFQNLTTRELQELLREQGLPVHYRLKSDLIERLSKAESAGTEVQITQTISEKLEGSAGTVEGENIVGDTAVDTEEENSEEFEDCSGKEITEEVGEKGKSTTEKTFSVDKGTSTITFLSSVVLNKFEKNCSIMADVGISFKDVEESLEKFSGGILQTSEAWIKNFEDIAMLCKWNEIQKFFYAKRLLEGSAKLYCESEANIKDWESLKTGLKGEFPSSIASAQVHRELTRRKKLSSESFQDYIYNMLALANRGKVDELSTVEYIINGITDDAHNKAMLYGAKSIADLKERIKTYELMKQNAQPQRVQPRRPQVVPQIRESKEKRCWSCGGKDHVIAHCPTKQKGFRCFKCSEHGHLASDCKKVKKECNQVEQKADNREDMMILNVILDDKEVKALIDTGSDITIMRKSLYDRIKGECKPNGPGITVIGFGEKAILRTICCLNINLKIQANTYELCCYVAPDEWLRVDMILGKNLFEEADLVVRNGYLIITRKVKPLNEDVDNPFAAMNVVSLIQEDELHTVTRKVEDRNVANKLLSMLRAYQPEKPESSCIKMSINLDKIIPIYQPPRRLSPKEKDVVTEQMNQWLVEGIIRPSDSDFASPIIIVKKKDGTHRICVDYRKLNERVVKDRYPLPLIEDVLDKLHDSRIFSTMDLKNGFFHVDVAPESRKYTAFVTPMGQYEFCKVPFGLCNSPSVFQRFINTIFHQLILEGTVYVYVDDLIIPSKDMEENLLKIEKVLEVAKKHGLRFKWTKCEFMQNKINFLGHVVSNGCISPSTDKIKAVRHFPTPRSVKEVQSFLGLTGYFRKFISGYSKVAKPLTDLMKKGVKFNFGTDQHIAMEILKEALCSEPVLKLYNPRAETELHTDACAIGGGAVLLQKDSEDQRFHPVYYMSFKMSNAEQRYSSYEQEVLTIIRALKRLRCYLLGLKFKVYTDCRAFHLTMKKKDLCARVAKWALIIEEFGCSVHHKPGAAMKHADALSRFPTVLVLESEILHKVRQAQIEDEFCKVTKRILENSTYEDYVLRNGLIYKVQEGDYILVIPKKMQREIIRKIHENGHANVRKVIEVVKKDYYFPNMSQVAESVIRNCVACILAARKSGKPEGMLNPLDKFDRPLHTYHVDHLGPLPSTSKDYRYIFVVVDAFSKFAWLYPTKTTNTQEVINKLEVQSSIFGHPVRIISDKGAAFISKLFEGYCEQNSIQHIKTTTGVPRGNGQAERINRNLVAVLSKISVEDPRKWFKFIPTVMQMLNSLKCRSTGHTPFELLIGTRMQVRQNEKLARIVEEELIEEHLKEKAGLREAAKEQILLTQEENRRNYNKKRKTAKQYSVGDVVAIERSQFGVGLKLYPKFLGPYKIVKVKGRDRYEVQKIGDCEGPYATSTSADHLKTWVQDEELSSHDEEDDPEEQQYTSEADETQDGRSCRTPNVVADCRTLNSLADCNVDGADKTRITKTQ